MGGDDLNKVMEYLIRGRKGSLKGGEEDQSVIDISLNRM